MRLNISLIFKFISEIMKYHILAFYVYLHKYDSKIFVPFSYLLLYFIRTFVLPELANREAV